MGSYWRRMFVGGVVALVVLSGCSSGDGTGSGDETTPAADSTNGATGDATTSDATTSDATDGTGDDSAVASGTVTLVVDGTSHDLTEFETCEPGPPQILDVIAETADGSVVLRGTLTPGDLAAVVIETSDGQFLARAGDIEAEVEGTEATVSGTATSTGSEAGEVSFELTAACD